MTRTRDGRWDRRRVVAGIQYAVGALLSAVTVGLLLAVLGGLLPGVGIHIDGEVWWHFAIAASLVGGNLIAMFAARQERGDG